MAEKSKMPRSDPGHSTYKNQETAFADDQSTKSSVPPVADDALAISIGNRPGTDSTVWSQTTITWGEFCGWLNKAGNRKDCGSYVFGALADGKRNKKSVLSRSALTLDVDSPKTDFSDRLHEFMAGHAYAVHTTWRSTAEEPRLRVIIPLTAALSAEDYRAAANEVMRRVSPDGGEFDPSSDEPERLMLKPSARAEHRDAYHHAVHAGEWMDATPYVEAGRPPAEVPEANPRVTTGGKPVDGKAYFLRAVDDEADLLAFHYEGDRNSALNRSAFKVAQLAHVLPEDSEEDPEDVAREKLLWAYGENGGLLDDDDGGKEFHRTFGNGWRRGLDNPRDVKAAPTSGGGGGGGGGNGKQSASTLIVNIALGKYRLGNSEKDGPFALPKQGAPIVKMLRGGKESLRAELAKDFRRATGKVAPQQALTDVLQVLEGEAQELPPEELHMRVAAAGGYHWYDLGDQTGRVVRIGPEGWQVVDRAPVLFQRTALTAPSPEPVPGGTVKDLYALTNAAPADQPLLIAAMVSTFWPNIAHPIVAFSGEQGTGKSTNAKRVTGVIDPTTVPLRKSPRDADSWVTAAAGSWVVTVDNITAVSDWFSDALCRASTGDGDVKRQLYKDASLVVFSFRRCVILTGIDLGGLRGDLTERLLRIELETIKSTDRLPEAQMDRDYAAAHPRALGALLDLVAQVMAQLPKVELTETMRLADFHRIVAAMDAVLGTAGSERYHEQSRAMAVDSLSANPFMSALRGCIEDFTGTAGELLEKVDAGDMEHHYRPAAGWPKTARAVTTLLRRNAPALRSGGWLVESAENRKSVLLWTLRSPESAG